MSVTISNDLLRDIITKLLAGDSGKYLTSNGGTALTWTSGGSGGPETDPVFTAWDKSTGISITESQISDLQSYLTSESDPIFAASDAAGITSTDIANWNGKQSALTGSISGTTNQVSVTSNSNSVAENITLSLPQDIATDSSPIFAGLTIQSTIWKMTAAAINYSSQDYAFNINSNNNDAVILLIDKATGYLVAGPVGTEPNTFYGADGIESLGIALYDLDVGIHGHIYATMYFKESDFVGGVNPSPGTNDEDYADTWLAGASSLPTVCNYFKSDIWLAQGAANDYLWNNEDSLVLCSFATDPPTCERSIGVAASFLGDNLIVDYIDVQQTYKHQGRNIYRADYVLGNMFIGDTGNGSATGSANFAVGNNGTLTSLTTGDANMAIGAGALGSCTEGNWNTAIGTGAMGALTTGSYNFALGKMCMWKSETSGNCIAIGDTALGQATDAHGTIAIGDYALFDNLSANNCVAIGAQAGNNNLGDNNIFIGSNAGYYETGSNKLFIDAFPRTDEVTARTEALIYGEFSYTPTSQKLYINGELYEFGVRVLTEETDPVFTASDAASITSTQISNWDDAYGWGDHSSAGYLTSESDPVFSASDAAGIDSTDISNWDDAYGWGDHAGLYSLTGHDHSGVYEPTLTKGNLSETTSSILTITGGTGAVIGSGTTIAVTQADSTHSGYLSSTDWGTFNGKQAALTGSISGTTDQVSVTSNSNSVGSNITLSLPQSINTTSAVNFGSLQIGTTALGADKVGRFTQARTWDANSSTALTSVISTYTATLQDYTFSSTGQAFSGTMNVSGRTSSATTAGTWIGTAGQCTLTANHAASLRGVTGTCNNNGAGTATNAMGFLCQVNNTAGGTITTAYGSYSTIANTSNGTIGTAIGFYMPDATNNGGGTITTLYGIKIENLTTGATNYSIYTGTAACYFGGAATVVGDLTVNGNTTLGDASTDTITCTGRLIVRTAASDPQHATPGSRPAGSLKEIVSYNSKLYFCTNASTPTWEKITSA